MFGLYLKKILTTLSKTQAGGALCFIVAILGWYITVVMMAVEMRVSISLPVGDLSYLWPRSDIDLAELEKNA